MARILIATFSMTGAWFSIQFMQEGHSVDIWLMKEYEDHADILYGLVPKPFKGKPDFKKYDVVLFDLTGESKIAENIKSQGIPVIGDCELSGAIEEDRLLGMHVMEECGIDIPPYQEFSDLKEAKKFVQKTNKKYVFKANGGTDIPCASTYVSRSPEDMVRYMDRLSALVNNAEFILQEIVQGTEISTEGWFNGEDFFCINSTLEEKKFLNDNKGPNHGCSGNLVWIYDQVNPPFIFREGLGKMKDFLQQHNYRGMIDINTIVSDTKAYGLEWTPRMGYDAAQCLFSCFEGVGDFIGAVASGSRPEYNIISNYSASVRLTIPPYPTKIKGKHPEGIPIEGIDEDEIPKKCFLYDCCLHDGELCTVGISGDVAVPIETGENGDQAWTRVYNKVDKINIPDMQYRTDLKNTTMKRYKTLAEQGWLG